MFCRNIGQLACVVGILFCHVMATSVRVHCEDEVNQALTDVGSGSAEEMKSRHFHHRITVFDVTLRAKAVDALPGSLRSQRIIEGKLFRRVEAVFNKVLQLHERNGKVDLFLFRNDHPSARVWRGCVVVISDGLAKLLYDDELARIFAHEPGHSYFEDEMMEARRNQDARAMRVIELRCDGIAILSLKLLGHEPGSYIRGLRRHLTITRRKGLSESIFPSHPGLVEREIFSQRFIMSIR